MPSVHVEVNMGSWSQFRGGYNLENTGVSTKNQKGLGRRQSVTEIHVTWYICTILAANSPVIWQYGFNLIIMQREKEGDLTQSYDETPYTNRKFDSITQPLRTDLGRQLDGQFEQYSFSSQLCNPLKIFRSLRLHFLTLAFYILL